MARSYVFGISLAAHAILGVTLAAIPARQRHEIIAISMSETKKVKERAPAPPPPPPMSPKPAARPVRAKVAPPPPTVAEIAPPSGGPSSDAVPDFGISLSNGSGGGLAVAAARPAATTAPAVTARTLTRPRAQVDDCDEPPAKPKLLSRPTPAYTDDARAAGVSGKVRVEITVDEHGSVVAVRVLQGLGHGLDEAALAAARGMTFEPALRCGKATSATFKVGFNFAPGNP